MAKAKTAYVCSACGAHSVKWQGQCPDCEAWNSLTETRVQPPSQDSGPAKSPVRLAEVAEDATERHLTGFAEFDRVLGGGLVPGSIVLLGGDPGVGKSTLLQQVAASIPADLRACYATGEESLHQIAGRYQRLGAAAESLSVLADTSLENVIEQARSLGSKVLVIDSIQTMSVADVPSAAGSVSQLRECVSRIVTFAKSANVSVFVIGHVTKEGAIAGPRVVEHMVDTVLYFENDPGSRYTVVRAVKNRFGATNELGVFAMTDQGFREVRNPSAIFLSGEGDAGPGSVITAAWEGSRPLLVELQSLVADGAGGYPKRLAQGVDQNRLAMIVAVLMRHGDIALATEDVFVNVVGGLRIAETSADLPVAIAVASSFRDRSVRQRLLAFGEIGLAGEIRPVRFGEERVREAAKQGFDAAIVPAANLPRKKVSGIDVMGVRTLKEALAHALD